MAHICTTYEHLLQNLIPVTATAAERCCICWLPFGTVDDDFALGIDTKNLLALWELPYTLPDTIAIPNNDPVQVPCQGDHKFGFTCLMDAFGDGRGSNTCPICRETLWCTADSDPPPSTATPQLEDKCELSVRQIILQQWDENMEFEVIGGEMILDLGRDIDAIAKRFDNFGDASPHPTIQPRAHLTPDLREAHKAIVPSKFARCHDVQRVAEKLRLCLVGVPRERTTLQRLKALVLNSLGGFVPSRNGGFSSMKWDAFINTLSSYVVNKAVYCSKLIPLSVRRSHGIAARRRGWMWPGRVQRSVLPPAEHIRLWWLSGRSYPKICLTTYTYEKRVPVVKIDSKAEGFRLADPYESWSDWRRSYCHIGDFDDLSIGSAAENPPLTSAPDTDPQPPSIPIPILPDNPFLQNPGPWAFPVSRIREEATGTYLVNVADLDVADLAISSLRIFVSLTSSLVHLIEPPEPPKWKLNCIGKLITWLNETILQMGTTGPAPLSTGTYAGHDQERLPQWLLEAYASHSGVSYEPSNALPAFAAFHLAAKSWVIVPPRTRLYNVANMNPFTTPIAFNQDISSTDPCSLDQLVFPGMLTVGDQPAIGLYEADSQSVPQASYPDSPDSALDVVTAVVSIIHAAGFPLHELDESPEQSDHHDDDNEATHSNEVTYSNEVIHDNEVTLRAEVRLHRDFHVHKSFWAISGDTTKLTEENYVEGSGYGFRHSLPGYCEFDWLVGVTTGRMKSPLEGNVLPNIKQALRAWRKEVEARHKVSLDFLDEACDWAAYWPAWKVRYNW